MVIVSTYPAYTLVTPRGPRHAQLTAIPVGGFGLHVKSSMRLHPSLVDLH